MKIQWRRLKSGDYISTDKRGRYEIIRYTCNAGNKWPRYLLYGTAITGMIPAFWELKSAKEYAQKDAENDNSNSSPR